MAVFIDSVRVIIIIGFVLGGLWVVAALLAILRGLLREERRYIDRLTRERRRGR